VDRVGLYSATACNYGVNEFKLDEGKIVIDAQRFGVINPTLNLSIINYSKSSTTAAKWLNAAEYAAIMIPFGIGDKVGPGIRQGSLGFAALTKKFRDDYDKKDKNFPPEIIQALVVPSRTVVLEPGGCISRMMFGEYRTSFKPYEVQLR
jgi:hypothetical protein